MLRELVVKYFGCGFLPSEEESLEHKTHELDPAKAADVLSMPNEALVKWLLGSNGT